MFVIPGVDILNGKCVQLINGRIETATVYGNPKEYIIKWINKGADTIHIIDLNAALNIGSNKELIAELIEKNSDVEIQVGGGIRNEEYAYELIERGAQRVIIGSKALDVDFLKKLGKKIPKDQIMAALDIKAGYIQADGWQTETGIKYEEGVEKIGLYVGSILSTDISSEGLLKGPDLELLKTVRHKNIPTYVSGGFTTKKDIESAKKLGFSGVIVGRALYEGKLEELW
jgi:phosphoribosylformimino-5-aminoimidazole carboxamide ribotide isomerase